MHFHTGYPT